MKKIFTISIVITLLLLLIMLVVGCQEQLSPQPVPTPIPDSAPTTPAPIAALPVPETVPAPASPEMPATTPAETPVATTSDTPTMLEEEVCAYIWRELPALLTDEYDITQFSKDSREAAYVGDGQWSFSISGLASDTIQLQPEIVEKFEDYWVEQQTREVTTCDLLLTAFFYEKTNLIEVAGVQSSNVTTKTEAVETPVKKEFTLNWLKVEYQAMHFYFEGSIRNHGRVPLKNLGVKFLLFDEEGKVLETVEATVEPDIIAPEENGKIYKLLDIEDVPENARYNCVFLTAAGEPFQMVPAPEGGKYEFYHVGGKR